MYNYKIQIYSHKMYYTVFRFEYALYIWRDTNKDIVIINPGYICIE